MSPLKQRSRELVDIDFHKKIWKTEEATRPFRIYIKMGSVCVCVCDNTRTPEITSNNSTNCNSTTKPYLIKLFIVTCILDHNFAYWFSKLARLNLTADMIFLQVLTNLLYHLVVI